MKAFVCLAILVASGILRLCAQAPIADGVVEGTVVDPQGAIIANAPVTFVDALTRRDKFVRTDQNGHYFAALPPGPYEARACKADYACNMREIFVKEGTTFRLGFELQAAPPRRDPLVDGLPLFTVPIDAPTQIPEIPESTPGISVIHFVAPVYPHLARSALIQGDVRIHMIVSRAGAAENVQVVSGHPMLNRAAIDAVTQWKFGLARPDRDADYSVVIQFRMLIMNADSPTNTNDFVKPELPDRVTVWGEHVGLETGDCGPLPRKRALQCLYLWRCKPILAYCQ